MGSVCDGPVKLGVLRGAEFAQGLALQLKPVRVMDEAVEPRVSNGGIAEHLWMPHRLTGESLRCGWLIRTILFMGSAFRSAVDARDAGRG
jgi:hypothetical protein